VSKAGSLLTSVPLFLFAGSFFSVPRSSFLGGIGEVFFRSSGLVEIVISLFGAQHLAFLLSFFS